jgi:hypothetical protein
MWYFLCFRSLLCFYAWLVVKQPVWSVILINTAEVLGFVPTVRKSWNRPYSETLFTYELSIFRQALTLFALQAINILTALTPITWVTVNVVITAILVVRRRQMPRPSAAGNVVAENTIVDEASVVTSKPANGGHLKTGQRASPRTRTCFTLPAAI